VLGVQPVASSDDIRTAFRRLAKTLHPDHNKLPGAREKFQEAKEAYDTLVDAIARADYDRELKVQVRGGARRELGALCKGDNREAPRPLTGEGPWPVEGKGSVLGNGRGLGLGNGRGLT
jgi:DnaJ-class molecular chaperone